MSKFIVSLFQQASAQTQHHACSIIWTTSKFKDFPGPRALISRSLKIHKKKFCDFSGVLIIWFETVLILPVRLYGHIHIFSLFTTGSLLFILLQKLFCQFTICSPLFIFVAETVLMQPVRLYGLVYMFTVHNLFTVVYIFVVKTVVMLPVRLYKLENMFTVHNLFTVVYTDTETVLILPVWLYGLVNMSTIVYTDMESVWYCQWDCPDLWLCWLFPVLYYWSPGVRD